VTHDACLGTDTLVAFIEGGTSAELRARVTEHAAGCTECRQLLSLLAAGSKPATPRAARAVPATIGRYVIERELGAGGMGVIYAARDPELDRTIAIKLLHGEGGPDMQQRLRREAQVMAQLAHPNVVRVYDVGTSDGHIYLTMELVVGENLGQWERTPHPANEILARYRDAGRGLAAAHAAGIVHRDFKPDNVLLGPNGVSVADFGLARSAGTRSAPPALSPDPVSPLAETVAATPGEASSIAGTPYYMAPEVYAGGEADARSDQFSFAVALYTSLFRQRPFEGDDLATLAANVRAGAVRPMPAGRVSRRVRSALRRALAVAPEDRFASMADLLRELEPPRLRWLAIPAGIAIAGIVVAGVLAVTRQPVQACGGADRELARVWNRFERAGLTASLAATALPYATATRREVERVVDAYGDEWRTMRTAACEATHVQAIQSEDVLALRMSCLDRRLQALAGLVRELSRGDRIAAAHAVSAARALPAIAECGDLAALTSPVRPPSAAIGARVAEVRGQLARLQAQREAGHYREPLAAAIALRGPVAALGYRPLEAELAALIGQLDRDTEHLADARVELEHAANAGDAGRDDRLVARALIALAEVLGHDLGKLADADAVLARVRAELERLDHPSELEIAALVAAGRNGIDAGTLDAAAAQLAQAVTLVERTRGANDLALVEPLRVSAHLELQRSHGAAAHAYLERALAIQRGVLGESHPDIAQTIVQLAGAEYMETHYDRAVELYRQALAILIPTYGAHGLTVAHVEENLANVYLWQGKSEEALAQFREVAAIASRELGPDHPNTLSYRFDIGSALEDLGRHREALAELTDVLARQRAVLGANQATGMTLHMIAFVELSLQHYAEARDHVREALAIMKQALGDSYGAVEELTVLGGAELGLGDPASAADALENAKRHLDPDTDPSVRAWLDAQLGRALYDARRDPVRGLALVRAGYKVLAADERSAENRAVLDAWFTARHLRPE